MTQAEHTPTPEARANTLTLEMINLEEHDPLRRRRRHLNQLIEAFAECEKDVKGQYVKYVNACAGLNPEEMERLVETGNVIVQNAETHGIYNEPRGAFRLINVHLIGQLQCALAAVKKQGT